MALPQHCLNPAIRSLSVICFVLILFLTVLPHPVAATISDDELDSVVEKNSVRNVIEEIRSVKIDGTRLMQPINQALKQSFEQEFPDTDVMLQTNGTEPALEALRENDWAQGDSGKAVVVAAKTADADAVTAALNPPVIAKLSRDITPVATDMTGLVGFLGTI